MILVVNADDAGADAARNRGILRSVREGIVRSASLLVTHPAATEFARESKALPQLSVGLHWNLTEGEPMVPGARSLSGPDGRFLGKQELLRRARLGLLEPREAEQELEAQWVRVEELLGKPPAHLDGHNHAHLFPGAAEAVARVVPPGTWVRAWTTETPLAETLNAADCYADPRQLGALLSLLTQSALALGWDRFRRVQRFEGTASLNGYDADDLLTWLQHWSGDGEEIVELMTHPGDASSHTTGFTAMPARTRELKALTDPRVLARAQALGICLVGFGGLP